MCLWSRLTAFSKHLMMSLHKHVMKVWQRSSKFPKKVGKQSSLHHYVYMQSRYSSIICPNVPVATWPFCWLAMLVGLYSRFFCPDVYISIFVCSFLLFLERKWFVRFQWNLTSRVVLGCSSVLERIGPPEPLCCLAVGQKPPKWVLHARC